MVIRANKYMLKMIIKTHLQVYVSYLLFSFGHDAHQRQNMLPGVTNVAMFKLHMRQFDTVNGTYLYAWLITYQKPTAVL